MKDYKQLKVWQEAHELAKIMHRIVKTLPKNEQYALAQQLWRASYSVPANIAEGASRATEKDFKHFLHTALGSARELSYFLLLMKDIGYIKEKEFAVLEDKTDKVCRMLINFITAMNSSGVRRPASRGD
ncbi:MAG: four helix bundle protein [Candidatus Woesearchaeota archaeon]